MVTQHRLLLRSRSPRSSTREVPGSTTPFKAYEVSSVSFVGYHLRRQGRFYCHGADALQPTALCNRHHRTPTQGKEFAIKVYKTSIMVFKDRDKYVSGEYRYRHGYCRSNPRKMVKVSQAVECSQWTLA